MENIESKSLLAKLMATENLIIEQRNVKTASFDVKNRILTVPMLDNKISPELYDVFMGHEVGHALYTPPEGMKKAFDMKMNMSVINIVEDSRIERMIKNKYPGLRRSFIRGYKELLDKDFFSTQNKDINLMNFLDRINLYCKGGVMLNIRFTEEERELLREVESTQTYDEVIEVAKKISKFALEQEKEKQQKRIDQADEDGEDENYDFSEDSNQQEEIQDYDDGDFDDESVYSDHDDTKGVMSHPDNHEITEEDIRSYTDEAYRKNESRLFADSDRNIVYANVPEMDPNRIVFDYKEFYDRYKKEYGIISTESFMKIRNESNKVVSYLVKEFEMRKNALQMKKASISKTGDLNMSRIFSYQFNDDIFKKITVTPAGKSHGLVMFLDWSGSMSEHIANTVKQLINLVLFCKKTNIPYEVYCFSDRTFDDKMYHHIGKDGDLVGGNFSLINVLSSRMSARDFSYAASALCSLSGIDNPFGQSYQPWFIRLHGTPLSEAVIGAMHIIPEFRKRNKIQIVNTVFLTDGEGNCMTSIRRFNNMGVPYEEEHYGIYNKDKDMVLRDPITRVQSVIRLGRNSLQNSKQITSALIKILKARTGCNVIGFYVTSSRELSRNIDNLFGKGVDDLAIKNKFRKDKFLISKNSGYDEYYILRSNALDTSEGTEFTVSENVTTRGLVSAFSKYSNNRLTNRVVLNRFIDLIV